MQMSGLDARCDGITSQPCEHKVLYGSHQWVPSAVVQLIIKEVNLFLDEAKVTWGTVLAPTPWLTARTYFTIDKNEVYESQEVPDLQSLEIELITLEMWAAHMKENK